jgi:hypothetical protein
VFFRHILSKQTVGANDRRSADGQWSCRVVYNHQVIADTIERILIAPREPSSDVGDGPTVFIEHVVSKSLQASYIAFVAGESDLERADNAEL